MTVDPSGLSPEFDMTDIERVARVEELLDECRPHANELVKQYTLYLTQMGNDEHKAFHCLTMYLLVGLEMGKYDEKAMLAMVAFMARRLSHQEPRLARSFN